MLYPKKVKKMPLRMIYICFLFLRRVRVILLEGIHNFSNKINDKKLKKTEKTHFDSKHETDSVMFI